MNARVTPLGPLMPSDAVALQSQAPRGGGASDARVKAYLGQVLSSLTGGRIDSIERLVYFDGKRRAQLEASLNREVLSASGGRLSNWQSLLSGSGQQALQHQASGSSSGSSPPLRIGNFDLGAGARELWNGVKDQPIPGVGLSPNQVVQGSTRTYNATARTLNQTVQAPVLPLSEPASSRTSVRARADAVVARASQGRFDSLADLVHFDGANKAANRLRGDVTRMLLKDPGAQAGGFSDWKQLLSSTERAQLERTLQAASNSASAPLSPRPGNVLSGIARNTNQILAPFNVQLPTAQDRSQQEMRAGANLALQQAGLPKLQALVKLDFNDPRHAKADQILGQYLYSNNLYGARAQLSGGKTVNIAHWSALLTPGEATQLVAGMEKVLLPKAVALSGINDPQGRNLRPTNQEAFNQIGAIKQQVQDRFAGVWPQQAKPLLGSLDALQGYTMDRQVDALRERLTQSGRPIDRLLSMGVALARSANPVASINALVQLDKAIARTGSTQPLEQALAATGMSLQNVAGVGKDLAVALASGDSEGARKLLASTYDLSTVQGQDRALEAINTLLAVYGGAKLTQAGIKKLGLFKDPNASALVPLQQTPQSVSASPLRAVIGQLDELTAQVDDAIASSTSRNITQLQQLKAQINDALGQARSAAKTQGRSPGFLDSNIAAEQALVRLDAAIKAARTPVTTPQPIAKPATQPVTTPLVQPPPFAVTPPPTPLKVQTPQPVRARMPPVPLFKQDRYNVDSAAVPAGSVGAQRNPNQPEPSSPRADIPGWNKMTVQQKLDTLEKLTRQPLTPAEKLVVQAGRIPDPVAQKLERLGINPQAKPQSVVPPAGSTPTTNAPPVAPPPETRPSDQPNLIRPASELRPLVSEQELKALAAMRGRLSPGQLGRLSDYFLTVLTNQNFGELPSTIHDIHSHEGEKLFEAEEKGPGFGSYDPRNPGNRPEGMSDWAWIDLSVDRRIVQAERGEVVIFPVAPAFRERLPGSTGRLPDGTPVADYYLGRDDLNQTLLGTIQIRDGRAISSQAVNDRYGNRAIVPFNISVQELEALIGRKLPADATALTYVSSLAGCELHFSGPEIDQMMLKSHATLIQHEREFKGSDVIAQKYIVGLTAGNPRAAESVQNVYNSVQEINAAETAAGLPTGTIRALWGEVNLSKEIVHQMGGQTPLPFNTPQERQHLNAWADAMGKTGMPVIIHCDSGLPAQANLSTWGGGLAALRMPSNLANIDSLVEFANSNPNTSIVWAHAGLGYTIEMPAGYLNTLQDVLNRAKNVKIDISWDAIHRYIAQDPGGWARFIATNEKSLLFGSDTIATTQNPRPNSRLDVADSLKNTGLIRELDLIDINLKERLFAGNFQEVVSPGTRRLNEFRSNPENVQWMERRGYERGEPPPMIWQRGSNGDYLPNLVRNPAAQR